MATLHVLPVDLASHSQQFLEILCFLDRFLGSLGILFALFLVMKPESTPEEDRQGLESTESSKQVTADSFLGPGRWALITITLALAVGAIAYHLMHGSSLHQSVVFFIGVPAVLAVILSLTPKAKSATGPASFPTEVTFSSC